MPGHPDLDGGNAGKTHERLLELAKNGILPTHTRRLAERPYAKGEEPCPGSDDKPRDAYEVEGQFYGLCIGNCGNTFLYKVGYGYVQIS